MPSDAAAKTRAEPSPLLAGLRMRILIYLGVLLLLLGFGSPGGGLIGLPIRFLLKNKAPLKGTRDGDLRPDRRGAELSVRPNNVHSSRPPG
jgi:hypothetical protein